jgi:outer membrane protein OmpA-like peptidoglycan-associated protein
VSKRNLFVSFAESDGGHSYLAARAMLDPESIAHLIFRNTVAESLEAVATGQANYAIVPSYNSITQWDGATLKALSSGAYEIHAQLCMPTSYVLVAHKDYLSEFVAAYTQVKSPGATLTAEDEAKIYTRFLSRIYVGPQAEEQYRGRLLRPDMMHAQIELSRNPLRILEERTRSDLLKEMSKPVPMPAAQNAAASPNHIIISTSAPPTTSPATEMKASAALVAAGLLDAPGDPAGWDQPGSLGEIVALLRKLLVLLNVYSLGSPDLPENKTQYLLLGRRGAPAPPNSAIRSPGAAPMRITARVVSSSKKSSADQWMKPRETLARRASEHGFVFDRPPMMLSPGNQRIFLFEGGRPRDGLSVIPLGFITAIFNRLIYALIGDAYAKEKTLRKALEQKPEGDPKDGSTAKFETQFLGQYPAWCHGMSDDACWCCEEAHGETHAKPWSPLLMLLLFAALLIALFFPSSNFSDRWKPVTDQLPLPKTEAPVDPAPTPTPAPKTIAPAPEKVAPPTLPAKPAPKTTVTPPVYVSPTEAAKPVVKPKVEVAKPPQVFHIAFFEGKSNLTADAVRKLSAAASVAIQQNRAVNIRIIALGARETDDNLWRRRLNAVQDELVRLMVPKSRIVKDDQGKMIGPFLLRIRPYQPVRPATQRQRLTYDIDAVPDPMISD